LNCV
jgi:hypothetical protein